MLISQSLFNQTEYPTVQKGLDAASLRQKASADNLANLTTPGFRRIEVHFEEELKKALALESIQGRRTHAGHQSVGRPNLNEVEPRAERSNDPALPGQTTNIDVDLEMAKLAENQILYKYQIRFMKDLHENLYQVIKESR